MKNILRRRPSLLFALLGGVGALAQLALRHFAFDHRHLLVTDHPAVTGVYVLVAAVLGLAFFLSRPAGKAQAAFPASGLHVPGATVMLLCVAYHCLQLISSSLDRLTIILALAGVVALVGFVIDLRRYKKGLVAGSFFYGAVTVFLLFYILIRQHHWQLAVQPARLFFPIVTVVFLALAVFYRAYVITGAACLGQYLFFHYGAVFFCLTAVWEEPFLFAPFALSLLLMSPPVKKQKMALPENVLFCLDKLKNAGYSAYVVGGCVRDTLLGIEPSDYDMCTNATPEQIAKVFSRYELVRNGEKHGTIGVVLDDKLYEITTFRTEGDYTDSRHPDWVEFVDQLEEDLARRDFTVNAMAYSPDTGYIDLFGGEQDLQNHILRAVGDPEKRFTEDALRILRGIRFAARFRLTPEKNTQKAMFSLAHRMDSLARERVFAELRGLLPLITAEDLLRYAPIITQVIPELAPTVDFEQHSPHHAYDVYTHTAYVVDAAPKDLALRFAALLHDVGKPECYTLDESGKGHFYGHAEIGAKIADGALLRLKAPTLLRQQVVTLIENHMLDILPDKKHLKKRLARFGEDTLNQILALQEADRCSKGVADDPEIFKNIRSALAEVLAQAQCLSVKDLAIDGKDLMTLGIAPGPKMGDILEKLLEMVLEETLENEKTALMQAAKQIGGTL